jgi:Flp pilus assembly pilin Flp
MMASLRRWYREEAGQDLLEYALLAAFVALAAIVGAQLIGSSMNSVYQGWDAANQDKALVETPDPIAGS